MAIGKLTAWRRRRSGLSIVDGVAASLGLVALLLGCEADSFMEPSVVGRWERTPVVLPILDRLDVIDEPGPELEGASQVQPEDLIPVVHEYVMGSGDVVTLTVFELMQTNVESALVRRINELGMIRLPVIGSVKASGITPTQLEKRIAEILRSQGVLKDAIVSVAVQEGRQNLFSVIGDPGRTGAAIGTYATPKSDFRILEALAMARGVSNDVKTIHVIRQLPLSESAREVIPLNDEPEQAAPAESPPDPVDLIEELLHSVDDDFQAQPSAEKGAQDVPEPPAALDRGMDATIEQPLHWAHVNGQWVRVDQPAATQDGAAPVAATMPAQQDATYPTVTQRVIEVPYEKLLEGDMRYNLVIRPGDIIRIPPPVTGNVYVGGAISRPGTYALPGTKQLTLKQLIFAAGNLTAVAIPERVDLIRRLGNDQEATVRLNLRAIFEGTQPDFYLKPNDTLNIGTNFAAVPLAVFRNGLRFSYGLGFVLDRNFGSDVFGPADNN